VIFVDNILEILWRLLKLFGAASYAFLLALGKIARAFWELLCEIDQLDWFTGRMNVFFDEIGELWSSSLMLSMREESMSLMLNVKEHIDVSKKARSWFFIILSAVLFFWFYPPYKWGPWHFHESGRASYYGTGFYFGKTSSGERFMPFTYTAAHKTLPAGITVKVVNKENGNTVYVQINDRGPFAENRVIDLSKTAAKKLGIATDGTANVEIFTRKKYGK